MINLKTKIIAGLLVLALVATTIGVVSAHNINGFSNPMTADERPIRLCWKNNLTDEQRQEIRQTVKELRDSEATPEEIRVTMKNLLEEMGVDLKENPCVRMDLTEEQKDKVHQTMQELRESGATPEEIRLEMQELFEEMGIDMGENPCMRMNRFGPRGFRYRQMSMKGT